MHLLSLFTVIAALIVDALAIALAAPELVARDVPSLPNWCGYFKHDDGQMGYAYANDKCEDFEWEYPKDTRPPESKDRLVHTLQNMHCPLCFVFEYVHKA